MFDTDSVIFIIDHSDFDSFTNVAKGLPAAGNLRTPLPPDSVAGEYTVTFYDYDFESALENERDDPEYDPEPLAETQFTITHNP